MRWYDCKGLYNAYFSLGSTCQSAYQLNRLGLRRYAGPLDWFISSSVPGLTRLFRNRFRGFMDLRQLQLVGTTFDRFVIRDSVYNIDSYHDFPLTPVISRLWDPYPDFKAKMDRRANRFLASVKGNSVCFVRTIATRQEARTLRSSLDSLSGERSMLLIVNLHPNDSQYVRYEEWGLDRVSAVTIPRGLDWKGSDAGWNTIMKGFSLR